jgi:uncharacterized membrane-anchored protein
MTHRRRLLFVALVAAQALLPLALIGWNEQALASGTHVTLKTAPVDPIDPFRGRYVALNYDISTLPSGSGPSAIVYVPLRDAGGVWLGGAPTSRQPAEGAFIRGRVGSSGRIEFGIERYFTDEDEARRLERAGPLLVDVVLDEHGAARIAGVRPVR